MNSVQQPTVRSTTSTNENENNEKQESFNGILNAEVQKQLLPENNTMTKQPEKLEVTTEKNLNNAPQILSKEYGPDIVIGTVPPQISRIEDFGDFGKITVVKTAFTNSNATYNVEMLEHPSIVSPFKELNISEVERSILMGSRNDLKRENAVISFFSFPKGISIEPMSIDEKDIFSVSHNCIPTISVLQENLKTLPLNNIDFPLIASPHPAATASYLHNCIMRRSNEGVDLRFEITAQDNGKLVEHFTLGRVWVPLNYCNILFMLDGDNYDARDPTLETGFDILSNPTLIHSKDISAFTTSLRFTETVDMTTVNVIYSGMKYLRKTKLSISRLYWRIWAAIFEASYWEERGMFFNVGQISMDSTPMAINNGQTLSNLLDETMVGLNPFFLCDTIRDDLPDINVVQYMFFLLSTSFSANIHFGVNTCWPGLDRTQLIYFGGQGRQPQILNSLRIRSQDLYDILHWFANHLDQVQLMEEIGRTVSSFLYRPEGDSTMFGHDTIKLSLPKFRTGKTILFLWPTISCTPPYEPKRMPLYKIVWTGVIHYLMLSLTFNTLLCEYKVPTIMQLAHNSVPIPPNALQDINDLFKKRDRHTRFVPLCQTIGLRLGWGQIWNRILGSLAIHAIFVPNFCRLAQWSDWLLFQRIQIRGSWMAAMMSHFSANKMLSAGRLYQSTKLSDTHMEQEVMLRMETFNVGNLGLIHAQMNDLPQRHHNVGSIANINGLPMDGQFSNLTFNDQSYISWIFILETSAQCQQVSHNWNKRKNYNWLLAAASNLARSNIHNLDSDLFERNVDWNTPELDEIDTHPRTMDLHVADFLDTTALPGGVLRFGHPQQNNQQTGRNNGNTLRLNNDEPEPEENISLYNPNDVNESFHYCESERSKTVGEMFLSHWSAPTRRRCEVLDHNSIANPTITKHTIETHISPVSVGALRVIRNRNNIGSNTDSNTNAANTRRQHQEAENRRRREEERLQMPNATRRSRTANDLDFTKIRPRNAMPLIWAREIPLFISSYLDVEPSMQMLVDMDPAFILFKPLTQLSEVTAQADSHLRRMVADLITSLSELHYATLAVKYHITSRGHYFRILNTLMQACIPYMPATGTPASMFKTIMIDFKRLSLGLCLFPAVTQDEWNQVMPNINAEGVLTTILGTDDIRAIENYIFTMPTTEKELSEAIDKEIPITIGQDIRNDNATDGTSLPVWLKTPLHGEMNQEKTKNTNTGATSSTVIQGQLNPPSLDDSSDTASEQHDPKDQSWNPKIEQRQFAGQSKLAGASRTGKSIHKPKK